MTVPRGVVGLTVAVLLWRRHRAVTRRGGGAARATPGVGHPSLAPATTTGSLVRLPQGRSPGGTGDRRQRTPWRAQSRRPHRSRPPDASCSENVASEPLAALPQPFDLSRQPHRLRASGTRAWAANEPVRATVTPSLRPAALRACCSSGSARSTRPSPRAGVTRPAASPGAGATRQLNLTLTAIKLLLYSTICRARRSLVLYSGL